MFPREVLRSLQGKKFGDMGRAATMLWISIGDSQIVPTRRDPLRVVGEYALHVYCAWRLSGHQGVLVGSSDMYVRDPSVPAWDFDPDNPGNAIADTRMRSWNEAFLERPLIIEEASIDACGGIALRLSNGVSFETFPTSSGGDREPSEQWRLFTFAEGARHYVMTDHGMEG